jgi:hypothetical protein
LYSDTNSLEEVDATLNNLDDEIDDTEHAVMGWSYHYLDAQQSQRYKQWFTLIRI